MWEFSKMRPSRIIDTTPIEVWSHILSFLELNDILNARLVSRIFYDASLNKKIAGNFKCSIDTKSPQLYKLRLYNVKICGELNSVHMDILNTHPIVTIEFVESLIKPSVLDLVLLNNRLRELAFRRCWLLTNEEAMVSTSVTKIMIYESYEVVDNHFTCFIKSFPNLNTLGLVDLNIIFHSTVVQRFYPKHSSETNSTLILSYMKIKELLATLTRTLESLIIIDYTSIVHETIIDFLNIPNLALKEANFEFRKIVRDLNVLEAFETQATSLRKLRLISGGSIRVTENIFNRFKLETCVLSNVTNVNFKFFAMIAKMVTLKTFILKDSRLNFETIDSMEDIENRTIESLGIIDCCFCGVHSVFEQIVKMFRHVKKFSLSHSTMARVYLDFVYVHMRDLQVLMLDNIKFIKDEWIVNASGGVSINNLTQLRVLDLSSNHLLTGDFLRALHLPNLRKIYLFVHVDSDSLATLLNHTPNLQCCYSDTYHFCEMEQLATLTERVSNKTLQCNLLVAPLNKHVSDDFKWLCEYVN